MTRLVLLPSSLSNNEGVTGRAPTGEQVKQAIAQEVVSLTEFAGRGCDGMTFKDAEKALVSQVFSLARLFVVLFLCAREETVAKTIPLELVRDGRRLQRKPAQPRNLNTLFGVIRYWRTYMRGSNGKGYHPLDAELGLTADRVSFNLLAVAVRLATKLSFSEARSTLSWFHPTPPSTEVIEQALLGMGARAEEWFKVRPAPKGDGEVLIAMFDSKGAPTATEDELARRRRKRRKKSKLSSPRHRGRERRGRYPKKPRRNKGDKSKHAKMATMVVMYTLHRVGTKLIGPINVRRYASFAPKEHAFKVARREADKRGFTQASGKTVQLVTDGDLDLACYTARYFPGAWHSIDVVHVTEKLWGAGECIHKEGTKELADWVETQKKRLYDDRADLVVGEIAEVLERTPKSGPGNKGKRDRLAAVHGYLNKRLPQLAYGTLLTLDLEISTGMIEGAIKNTIGKRCDHGGMRWIKERVEPVVQLRCIELDGEWDEFTAWFHDQTQQATRRENGRPRIQRSTPLALPDVRTAA